MAVGQDPEAVAAVGGANGGCAETCPLDIEPQGAKVVEDDVEAPADEGRDVLAEDEPWLDFCDGLLILLMAPRSRLVAVTGMLLGLYGPILRLLVGLNRLEVDTCCLPQQRDIARGLISYSIAPVSYWSGGFRGLCRLAREVFTDGPSVQQRTRETA